jgi:hypothetical protein
VLTLLLRAARAAAALVAPLRFDVLVPAHDEAAAIGALPREPPAMDWPRDRFRVW